MFDIPKLTEELLKLKNKSENPEIWNDENAKEIFKKISLIERKIENFNSIDKNLKDIEELYELSSKDNQDDLLGNLYK